MKRVFKQIGVVSAVALIASSCTKDPASPGVEYMPDMYRSPAVEAYVDYGEFRNEEHPELKEKLTALTPPSGTVPYHSNMEEAAYNMPVPFKAPPQSDKTHGLYGWEMYADGKEFDKAMEEVIKPFKNPVPYSDEAMARGKELYLRMCSQCHGEKGDGKGILVQNKKISGVANFTAAPVSEDTDGQLFYYITYGKGIMGAHGMLISREDRWNIVHQLRKFGNGDYPNVETVEEEETNMEPMAAESDSTDVETPEGH